MQDEVYSGVGAGGRGRDRLVADDGEHICRRDDASGGGDDVGSSAWPRRIHATLLAARFERVPCRGHDRDGDAGRGGVRKERFREGTARISSFAPISLTGEKLQKRDAEF